MAVNLLPILLLGGAAAVVVTQKKKKDEDEKKCPPTTVITIGEMKGVAERALAKHGGKEDPADEANFFVNEVLPPGCHRASVNSRVKIQIPGEKNDFEMTIPDVYMLTFAQSLSTRANDGKVSEEKGEEFWARELDWYKKTTGTNFDPARTGIVELGKAVLRAMQDAMEKVGGKPSKRGLPLPPGVCPTAFEWDLNPGALQELEAIIQAEISRGNRDAFKIGDAMLHSISPPGCTKSDYQSVVHMVMAMPGIEPEKIKTNVAVIYGGFVWGVAKGLLDRNIIGPPKIAQIRSKILGNYKTLTGETFPEPLD